jgi:hypothetical protein
MRHKVAAKRALVSQIQTATEALSPPFAASDVIGNESDLEQHAEVVAVTIATGQVGPASSDGGGGGRQNTRTTFALEVLIAVDSDAQTADEAEDRVATIADAITRSLAVPETFSALVRPATPPGRTWTVVSAGVAGEEGPRVEPRARTGLAAYGSLTIAVTMTLGR